MTFAAARFPVALALALALAAAGPPSAVARGGDDGGRADEVRAAGACGRGPSSKLRLRREDGVIKVEFEVEHVRGHSRWRVVLVQEGRVAWRGRRRPHSGAFRLRRRLQDLPGADGITARATSRRGVICVASATLPG